MNIFKKLADISLDKPTIVCFSGQEYPLLFFRALKIVLHEKYTLHNYILTDTHTTLDQHMLSLSTSFLGQDYSYWLGDLSELSAQEKKKWLTFCNTYTGPHTLFFFIESSALPKNIPYTLIELPEKITLIDYKELALIFNKKVDTTFIQKLFTRHSTISLENASLLLSYQQALGSRAGDFFEQWLNRIVEPDKSLFVLSQHFFARRSDLFWPAWSTVTSDYPEEFWIAFWSEQLWQAAAYIQQAQKTNTADAKKLVKRLPFSFLNKDWKLHTTAQLSTAHSFLYTFDYRLKNGATDTGLELFYHKFLAKQF